MTSHMLLQPPPCHPPPSAPRPLHGRPMVFSYLFVTQPWCYILIGDILTTLIPNTPQSSLLLCNNHHSSHVSIYHNVLKCITCLYFLWALYILAELLSSLTLMTTSAPSWHLRDDQEELAERKNVPHIFHESSEALARNQEFGSGIWKAHSLLTSYRRQEFLILPSFSFPIFLSETYLVTKMLAKRHIWGHWAIFKGRRRLHLMSSTFYWPFPMANFIITI